MVENVYYIRMAQQSDEIVEAIIFDITCLAGIRKEWYQIDEDIQGRIRKEWKQKVMDILYKFQYRVE